MAKLPVKKLFLNRPKMRFKISWTTAFLLVVIGTISFVYVDGLTILYRSWISLVTPHLEFEIKPQSTILPADSTTQIYIDALVKNNKNQLLDGSNITVVTLSGQAQLSSADVVPTDVSRRWWLVAPAQPQVITLSFNYKHLVKTLVIDVYDTTPPPAPIIKAPADNTVFTTATPIISGEGPEETKIEIYIDNILNTTTDVDNKTFSTTLQTAQKKGKHQLYAISINKFQVRSSKSSILTIDIQTPDPEIDILNLRISPNPVKANQPFRIFVPISSDIKDVQLILDTKKYALQDMDKSSIFSGEIPAPTNPGLYRLSLVITSSSGESILAEKVASIEVN